MRFYIVGRVPSCVGVGLSLPTVAQGHSDGRQAFQVLVPTILLGWAFHYYPSRKKRIATGAQFYFSGSLFFGDKKISKKSFAILLPKSRDQDRRRHEGTKFADQTLTRNTSIFLSD